MTTQQLHLFNCFYLAVLLVVVYFTRATARRIAGALAGGATLGVVCLGAIALAAAAAAIQTATMICCEELRRLHFDSKKHVLLDVPVNRPFAKR
jgi:hypothetical protein